MKKRIISMLLALVMALTVVNAWEINTAQAAEEKVISDELAGYRRVTLNEFTWANGGAVSIPTADAGFGGYRVTNAFYGSSTTVESATSRSLDKTYLDMDIKTENISTDMQLHLFLREKYTNFIRVKFYDQNRVDFTYFNEGVGDSSTQSQKFTLSNFGRSSASDYFNLKVRADFTVNASDSSKRDTVLQFWINNRFAYQMNLTATDLRNGISAANATDGNSFYLRQPTVTLDNAVEGGFDSWTFNDLNIGDITITGNTDFNYVKPASGTANLDGSLFQGKINFGSSAWHSIPVLMIGGSPLAADTNHCGFRFRGSVNALVFDFLDTAGNQLNGASIAELTSTKAGVSLTNNENLTVAMSINYLDVSGGLVKASIGLFFNGMLYDNRYFIVENLPEAALTRHIKVHAYTSSTESLSIASYPGTEFTEWTFSDLDVADQTLTAGVSLNGRPAPAGAATLDKTFFRGMVYFPNASNAVGEFFVSGSKNGASTSYAGLFFRDNWTSDSLILRYRKSDGSDPVTIATFTPSVAGTNLRANRNLCVGLSAEILSEPDSNGNVNTRLGVYFDGNLYNSRYITVSLPQDILYQDIKWSSPAAGVRIASYPFEVRYLKNELDDYERVDMFDYECTGARVIDPATGIMGFAAYDEAKALISDFNHSYLDFDLNLSGTKDNYVRFLGETKWKNMFSLYVKDSNTLGLQYLNASQQNVEITEFSKDSYDVSWGSYFNVKFRVDITAVDSARDNIFYQLWINGIFAAEGVVTFDYGARAHTRTYFYIKSADDKVRADISAATQLAGYRKIVPDDFNQLSAARSAEGTFNNSSRAGEYSGEGSLSGTVLNFDIKADSSGQPLLAWLSKGKDRVDFYGDGEQIVFYMNNSVLYLQEIHGGRGVNTETVTLGNMAVAPYNYSADSFFNFKLRTKIYDSGIIELMVYINDSLLNVAYVSAATKTLTNAAEKFMPLYSDQNLADMTSAGLRGTVDYPTYTRTAIENEQLRDATYDLSKGVYLLTGAPSFKVNGINRSAGYTISNPGVYTIQRIIDGKVASTQKVTLTNGTTPSDTLTYDYLGGNDVMPIGGFYGPSTNAKVTPEVMELIAESGINLITYQPIPWYEGNEGVLRCLDLAEKNGIGVYVMDSNLNTVERNENGIVTSHSYLSSAKDLAEAMEGYSAYSSFLGIFVFDEPKPDNDSSQTYSATNSYNRYGYYKGILQALQPYTNITGYINLHGDGTFVTDAAYRSYLTSIVGDIDVLSFDAYPYLYNQYAAYRRRDYLDSLDTNATFSRTYNKPFWSYIQAGTDYRDDASDGPTTANYSEADTMWNANTSLAFGAKGIVYFPMMQPEFFSYDATASNGHDYDRSGLIGADNNANRYYNMVKRVNTQVAACDDVLMNAQFKGVVVDGAAASDINYAATTGKKHSYQNIISKSGGKYTDSLVSIGTGSSDGTMIGCFDYEDSEAFWVVNYSRTVGATQRITLNFDKGYDLRVVRNGQSSGYKSLSQLNLTLDSGEAALVVLGSANTDTFDEINLYMGAEVGSAITAQFYAEVPESVAKQYDQIVLRAKPADSAQVTIASVKESDGKLRFALPDIYLSHMTEKITASLVGIKNGSQTELINIGSGGISVAEYFDTLAAANPNDDELLAFMANMLKAGEECQKYTGYRTGASELAMYNRTWAANNIKSEAPVSAVSKLSLFGEAYDGHAFIRSAGLNITDKILVWFKVYAHSASGLKLVISGDGITPTETTISSLAGSDGLYYVDYAKLNPSAYNTAITAQLKRGNEVLHTVRYSVNAYCVSKVADRNLRDLVYAIYNYGEAAYEYKKSR
ncbi:MAG: hypothetical protein IKR26_05430 [Lachnospiraceae bacterium]|nr:hypothetical protein [Lachnospiraceae bacterium]